MKIFSFFDTAVTRIQDGNEIAPTRLISVDDVLETGFDDFLAMLAAKEAFAHGVANGQTIKVYCPAVDKTIYVEVCWRKEYA